MGTLIRVRPRRTCLPDTRLYAVDAHALYYTADAAPQKRSCQGRPATIDILMPRARHRKAAASGLLRNVVNFTVFLIWRRATRPFRRHRAYMPAPCSQCLGAVPQRQGIFSAARRFDAYDDQYSTGKL